MRLSMNGSSKQMYRSIQTHSEQIAIPLVNPSSENQAGIEVRIELDLIHSQTYLNLAIRVDVNVQQMLGFLRQINVLVSCSWDRDQERQWYPRNRKCWICWEINHDQRVWFARENQLISEHGSDWIAKSLSILFFGELAYSFDSSSLSWWSATIKGSLAKKHTGLKWLLCNLDFSLSKLRDLAS